MQADNPIEAEGRGSVPDPKFVPNKFMVPPPVGMYSSEPSTTVGASNENLRRTVFPIAYFETIVTFRFRPVPVTGATTTQDSETQFVASLFESTSTDIVGS